MLTSARMTTHDLARNPPTPLMTAPSLRTTRGIGLLAAAVLLLTAAPRLNIQLGPVPVYLVDFFLVGAFMRALPARPFRRSSLFRWPVLAIVLLITISEINGIARSGESIEPIYEYVRMLLAISLFFSASVLVRTEADVRLLLKCALVGALVTATLMIMTSLPGPRSIATQLVFRWEFLEPAADSVLRGYVDNGEPARGRSLIGVSIMSGAFLNVCWPLAALLYRWQGPLRRKWRNLALLSMILTPIGTVMSYSRGAVLGLLFVVLGALLTGANRARRGIVIGALAALTLFTVVGWDSDAFFFERLENRSRAMIENPLGDVRETGRVYAYIDPFIHLQSHPEFMFYGGGQTYANYGIADHSLFAKAYIAYGMTAAILYVYLSIWLLLHLWQRAKARSGPQWLASSLQVSSLGLIPWLLFGHAVVSTPRGAMLYFLLLGLTAALRNFGSPETARPLSGQPHPAGSP